MKQKALFISMVIAIALPLSSVWGGPKMNPGMWEITTQTEMAGIAPQSMTHTQCITGSELVPMSKDANQECRTSDIRTSGNTVTWKISCGGQGGGMTGTGKATYSGDSMNGTMQMTISGSNVPVKNTLKGRRIGACAGSQAKESVQSSSDTSESSDNQVAETIAEDAKDVGKAAKDEAKQSTVDEVRKGVKGAFKSLFK